MLQPYLILGLTDGLKKECYQMFLLLVYVYCKVNRKKGSSSDMINKK